MNQTTQSRVIVLDNIAEEGLAKLEAANNIEFDVKTGLTGEELKAELANYDGAVCRSGVKITAESLEGNNTLKAVSYTHLTLPTNREV